MSYTIHLSKETFKFSATHFTLFSETRAENLHGHNYYVSLALGFKEIDSDTGLAAEFSDLKKMIKEVCDQLDEKVLIPTLSPYLQVGKTDENYELRLNNKFYSFPIEDCEVLNIVNTSSECLAKWISEFLEKGLKAQGVEKFRVTVKETNGQSVSYLAP